LDLTVKQINNNIMTIPGSSENIKTNVEERRTSETKGKDIWSLIKESKKREKKTEKPEDNGIETVMLFLGQKQAGKSSLISRFLDKDESPTPSVALEYTFGRRTNANGVKDVTHIWELGM
jgi:putative ribosome biogenesis GTPase RsgA